MAIKRYRADYDTTIVNAYEPNFETRGTGSNMGMADVMEVFSVYGRISSASQELSRVLVQFPTTTISTDRTAGTIPASGSVSFYLRLFNAQHSKTVPKDYKLVALALSQSWQEGVGLDLETYKDVTDGNTGANWMSASNTTGWTDYQGIDLVGASTITSSADYIYEQSFETGLEDLDINITPLVESWLAGTITNNGILVRLSSSYEASASRDYVNQDDAVIYNPSGSTKSYYTKRFFSRGSQYFYKRPVIEARWNSSKKDDRGNFYYSSSLAPAADNLNTLYIYNYVRGALTNIPAVGTGEILVSLYSGSSAPTGSKLTLYDGNTNLTGGWVSTGIYSCSVAITAASTPLDPLFDVWHSGGVEYVTGSIVPNVLSAAQTVSKPVYYLNITNMRRDYRSDETARFNLYIRNKNWQPTIYTVANNTAPATTIPSASYRIYRVMDGYEVLPYGTSSNMYTMLSYDVSGNYFDFDMNILEPGYEYAFKFAFYDPALTSWSEQSETFRFRVEDYEY